MGRRALILAFAVAVGLSLLVVPRWSAAREEMRRQVALEHARQAEPVRALPDCPPAGPELDTFLQERERVLKTMRGAGLWIPVCRIAPVPDHKILIMATNRSDLSACASGSVWRPANVLCALEEPLGFLADPRASRTWARHKSGETIWLTSRPVAWQDHLIAEHRQRMSMALIAGLLLVFAARRTRQAAASRAACHGPEEVDLPHRTELLLHWVLGQRCQSLPGDLSEEYAEKLDHGFSPKEARQWYRWQVFHSIAPVTARLIESLLERGFRFNPFTRRS